MSKKGMWILLLVAFLASVYFFWGSERETPVVTNSKNLPPVTQGNVTFYSGDTEKTISVEIARSESEHSRGLMDRTSLPHNQGMLFLFEEMAPRSFWMRNTRISLDIIYLNDRKQIVSIQKNAVPMSEESLPSEGPAQYVVEVNGGFTDLYQIQPGDSVRFEIP